MDPELLELVARLNGEGEALTDEELSGLRDRVSTILGEINRDAPTDADLQVATEGASVIRAVLAEAASRASSAAERAERLATELDGLELPEVTDETVEEVPAETAEEVAPVEDAPAEVAEAELVPVAAAAVPERLPLPRISALASRTPKRNKPVPTATSAMTAPPTITASGDMPGISAGREVTMEQFAEGVASKWHALTDGTPGDGVQLLHLGKIRHSWSDDWFMTSDQAANEQKYRRIVAEAIGRPNAMAASGGPVGASLTASGGICGPLQSDYGVSVISSAVRPVRDGMVQTGATRGGIRYIAPPTLSQVHTAGPANIWTAATDAAPGGSTKGFATYVCQGVLEKSVDAIVSRVRFGNFQARYFPEQVDAYMQLVEAEHARLAEGNLLATMVSGSTAVTAGNNGTGQTGWASEYLAEIDRIVAAYRYEQRMAPDAPLQLMYPEWSEDAMRADLARELPGNSGGQSERLAVADAEIDRFFTTRNLMVSSYLDNPIGFTPVQGFVVQGAGQALPWPTKVLSFVFAPGTWQFLDGGELNLGLVRDSTLSGTNSFEMFSETFEAAVFRGAKSLAVTMDLCPDGSRAAAVDTSALCGSGS